MVKIDTPPVVDNIEAVHEKVRSFYTKGADGKFTLDKDIAETLDTSGISKALDSERKSKKELDKQIAAWKALGDSPEEIKEKMDAMNKEDKADDKKTEREKLKKDTEAAIKKQKEEFDAALSKKDKSLQKYLVDNAAIAAISELKGVPDLLSPVVTAACMIVEDENGNYQVRIRDKDGDARGDGKGGYMTVKDFVAELKQSSTYGRAFDSNGQGGSGSPRGGGGSGGAGGGAKMTSVQKIAMGLNKRNQR